MSVTLKSSIKQASAAIRAAGETRSASVNRAGIFGSPRNGVNPPAEGGKCWAVWALVALTAVRINKKDAKPGDDGFTWPTLSQVSAQPEAADLNASNVMQEYYRCKRYHRSV